MSDTFDALMGCTKNQDLTWDPNIYPGIFPIYPYPGPTYPSYPATDTTTKITFSKKEEIVSIPELYDTDLQTLQYVMTHLEDIAIEQGVFSVEIRVKTDDVSVWAVIGYGEAGDPCVLRFREMTPSKSVIKRWRVMLGKDPLPPEWEDDGDRSWIKEEVPGKGNGIGPCCRFCGNLIDFHPVDHALDCARNGDSSGLDQ